MRTIENTIQELENELAEIKAHNARKGMLLVYSEETIQGIESLIEQYKALNNEGCGSNA
jgi:hypothetical protein